MGVQNQIVSNTSQLIIVKTNQWSSIKGECFLFEKQDKEYKFIRSFKIVLGRNGLKWGEGLHTINDSNIKQEGDGTAPAGIFLLGNAFGNLDVTLAGNWPYIRTSKDDLFIDDSKSVHYNRWVVQDTVKKDWNSHEVMLRPDGLYNRGLVIQHNMNPTKPGFGSAIFFHIWKNKHKGTAGCTAADKTDVLSLLNWIKKDAQPLLIQLPKDYLETVLNDL